MRNGLRSILVLLVVAPVAHAQLPCPRERECPEPLRHIKAVLSTDTAVRAQALALAKAQNFLSGDCYCQLAASLDKVVLKRYLDEDILPLFTTALQSDDADLRHEAAMLGAFFSMMHRDGAWLLEKFVEPLIKRFDDRHNNVKNTAVHAVADLKPSPPAVAAEPLLALLGEPTQAADAAFIGLTRITPMPKPVATKLVAEIEQTADVNKKANLLRSLGRTADLRDEILGTLITSLRSDKPEVIKGALAALSQLGPRAASASSEVRRLAHESPDDAIAKSAGAVVQRLESPKEQWPKKP